jgi:D-alanyl-D-alanine carboxypeptidase
MAKYKRNSLKLIATVALGTICTMLSLFTSTCFAKQATVRYGISSVKIQLLQKTIDRYLAKYHIPGISVSIIVPNSDQVLTLTSGVMNVKTKETITPNTLFQIGSITKVYTATLIHQLISNGRLTLSQTIGHWLPQYKQWKSITIKQLLNMHSGIPSYTENKQFNAMWQRRPESSWNTSTILEYVKDQPLLYQPGTHYNYSDTNYILLGMIVEKSSHQSYSHMLKQNILEPLRLRQTYYISRKYTKNELHKLATGYSQAGKDETSVNMSQADAAGAIVATTKDTALFFNAVFLGNLIKPKELKAMLVTYSIKSGNKMTASSKMFETWALGVDQQWFKNLGLIWNKFGITPGGFFGSANYSIKGQITIVMAANKTVPQAIHDTKFIPKLYEIIGIGINKK